MDALHKAAVLRDGPIGRWTSALGTAAILGSADITFGRDGRGCVISTSPMTGREEDQFEWAPAGPGRIRLRMGLDDPEHDGEWTELAMEFRLVRTDIGETEALAEAGQPGFWWLLDPVAWAGP